MLILADTHSITSVIVAESENNMVQVTVEYLSGSDASGVLSIFVLFEERVIEKITSFSLQLNTSVQQVNLPAGRYEVSVYDVESDGILSSGVVYAAATREIVVNDSLSIPLGNRFCMEAIIFLS